MKYHALFVIFEKAAKFEICHLLQIIGGALWVDTIWQTACWVDYSSNQLLFKKFFQFSHSDGSFEYPQHMFWLRNKKSNFSLGTVN